MDTQEKEFQDLYSQFLAWQKSQATQTDGFEYERSFLEFCRSFNHSLLSIATKPVAEEQKKK